MTASDDRLPVVLVILEGLGDRPVSALGGRTPAEAADTPVLDELATRGASGLHLPFGWGRAATPELVRWALLGYEAEPFCGPAVLEAQGAGVDLKPEDVVALATLRRSEERSRAVWVTGPAEAGDEADGVELFAALAGVAVGGIRFGLRPLRAGEAILTLEGATSGAVTDTDPLLPDRHPVLRPQPFDGHPEAAADAGALERFLAVARQTLASHPVNARRRASGAAPLDVLTTRWAGRPRLVSSFPERVGCAGGMVTAGPADQALASLLGLAAAPAALLPDPGADIGYRVALAGQLLVRGAALVTLHSSAAGLASAAKDPPAKRDVIESLDRGLGHLPALAERAVVAVLADGTAPSSGGLARSADPAPLVVVAPTLRPDSVDTFGEAPAAGGSLGVLRAAEILPLLLGLANRPWVVGYRPAPAPAAGLPDHPDALSWETDL